MQHFSKITPHPTETQSSSTSQVKSTIDKTPVKSVTACLAWHTPSSPSLPAGSCSRDRSGQLCIVQADFLHRKGYNLMFILCVVIKAIGYLLCAVLVVSSFFLRALYLGIKKSVSDIGHMNWPLIVSHTTHSWLLQLATPTGCSSLLWPVGVANYEQCS